ncbi:MAG TPA: hypothetical protein VK470_04870 [Bacteroidota bacterium]|nr:hypothetical protein [Bacteroidota bacterium]
MTRLRIFGVALLAILIVSSTVSFAGSNYADKGRKLQKVSTNDDKATILINNIFNYYSNNGDGSYNTYTGGSGLEWPKGSGNTAIFEDGLVWSGYYGQKGVEANLRTGGSAYRHGLQAGRILNSGVAYTALTASDPGDAANRTYRVRPDITPKTPLDQALKILQEEEVPLLSRDVNITAQQIYENYIKDWNEWPATQGAPFDDKNHNGVYDPDIDSAGVPGADQTLWHVSNDLDASRTTYMYGSNPIGLEYQRTIWAYRRTGALGNTIFTRNKIINKSNTALDSAFFSQWSDPDLGDAGDDFVGCDISRSLGYVYNGRARDTYYGDKPPAAGYDFFQGPLVVAPGDSGIFNNQRRYGYKNLGMSAFNFFINGSTTYSDPAQGLISGTRHWYNLMNGTVAPTGAPNRDLITGQITKFVFSGDPATGKGWTESNGSIAPPGDRRLCMVTGPFKLNPGDTQEVVVATLVGQGGDRISSVSVLKFYSDIAQSAFDNFFNLAAPPPQPTVSIAQLDGELVLNWSDINKSEALEAYNSLGYKFEGYNVYQASTPAGANKKLLATYDVVDGVGKVFDNEYDEATGVVLFKPVQFGNDNGVVRYYDAKEDALNSRPLINGQSYYYAVTAYSYNETATPKALESAPQWKLAVPQKPTPGTRYTGSTGDTVHVTHSAGISDGSTIVTVVDPTKVTGHDYSVFFETADGVTTWGVKDVTTNTTVLSNQENQTGDINYGIIDGLMVKVLGPAPGMKRWSIPAGVRLISPVGGFTGLGLEGFSSGAADAAAAYDQAAGTIGMAGHFAFGGVGTTLGLSDYHSVVLKFAAVDATTLWDPKAQQSDENFSKAYRYLRAAGSPSADPSFTPWIINKEAGYPYQDFNYSVPFSAWDMETDPPTRLAVGMFENNAKNATVDGRYWPPTTDGDNSVNREFAFIFKAPYSTTPDPKLAVNLSNNATTPLMWVMTCARRNANSWQAGNEFLITASHVNTVADKFTFTAPKITASADAAKVDVEKINVFPNPYFGFNLAETSKYERFVTFSHLPKNATIRIFTLAGVLIRTLVKPADDTQQFMRWNLSNEAGVPVVAGMFIAYIEMPDLGKTKILKFAVIPESQILDKL